MRLVLRIMTQSALILIMLASAQCNLLSTEQASCSQTETNLVGISGDPSLGSCGDLIKTLDLHDILVTPEGTFYEVLGEILIDFDNDYYLRGAGIEDINCLSPIIGQSPFTVRAVYSSCSEEVAVEVLSKLQLDAPVLCTFTIATGKNCAQPEKDLKLTSSPSLPSSPRAPAGDWSASGSSRNRP